MRNAVDQLEHLSRALGVDQLPIVRGLVILPVDAGEREEHRDALAEEVDVVGAAEHAAARPGLLVFQPDLVGDFLDELFEALAGPGPVDLELAFAEPADHVHVDHGLDAVEVDGRLLDEMGAAQQALLLAAEGHEQDVAAGALAFGEGLGHLDHARGAGGVVVRAVEDSVRTVLLFPLADVVVVRADHDDLVGAAVAAQQPQHVARLGDRPLDAGVDPHAHVFQVDRQRLALTDQRVVERLEVEHARLFKDGVGQVLRDVDHGYRVARSAARAKAIERVFVRIATGRVDDQHALRALFRGQPQLALEPREV